MAITIQCAKCCKAYTIKDHVPGRRYRCKACGCTLEPSLPTEDNRPRQSTRATGTLPAVQGVARQDTAASQAASVCSGCGSARAQTAVICVQCGMDFRTGRKLSRRGDVPQKLGNFSLSRGPDGAWQLAVARTVLWVPITTRQYDLAGYDRVYYDTLDANALHLAPDQPAKKQSSADGVFRAAGQLVAMAALLFSGANTTVMYSAHNAEEEGFYFEVGLLGPGREPIRLRHGRTSSEIREIATWLSEATGIPIERRDRRTT